VPNFRSLSLREVFFKNSQSLPKSPIEIALWTDFLVKIYRKSMNFFLKIFLIKWLYKTLVLANFQVHKKILSIFYRLSNLTLVFP
jgi:hypothetical protein